jgi:uncharacterized membrane protein YcaP (DUF421 family)
MSNIFFDNWQALARTVIIGVSAYIALLILLRISGKRTLSKMNAFDFVITIALGSTLATTLLSKDTALAEGVLALALLVFLQYVVSWLSVRSKFISGLVKAEPKLLYLRGDYLRSAMKKERVNDEEILQAMRNQGIGDTQDAEAVILETDGTLNIIKQAPENAVTTTLPTRKR